MLALISPAKTMRSNKDVECDYDLSTQPRFLPQSGHIATLMVQYSREELSEIFKISIPIARELKSRFISLMEDSQHSLPALESYDGVVYKHLKREFSPLERQYLQRNLRISSLLYGLLRPYDTIKPYRMEGFVRLSDSDERVDKYWRGHQTQTLIDDVQQQGGVLLYLASKEEQNSFNWSEVKKQVRVIDFLFLQPKGDKLRQVVIYTKMARGEMIRYMIDNLIEDIEQLKNFEWGGYSYREELSSDDKWVWVME